MRVENQPISTESTAKENLSPAEQTSGGSYSQILKSSSIVGGAQVINMVIGILRTKFVAVLLGPAGVGLMGIYLSITSLANVLAGMGIQLSGVRDVARFHANEDREALTTTAITLRRVCWVTGICGWLLLAVCANWLSEISFGSDEHASAITWLGAALFFTNLAGGQTALLQGMRRIGDLARKQVLGALLGTFTAVFFYWWFGIGGVVPAIIGLSVVTLAVSTYFARKVRLEPLRCSWRESWRQALNLMRFGGTMVIAGLVGAGATYAIRAIISGEMGLEAVGIYTAAFTVSGLFVQFVLQAMGTDFYPRLTAVSHDNSEMRRLINEQTEVGLLLAFPGLLATLALAPWVIRIFYTAEFAPAGQMLKWFVIGCMGRVISWPLGYSLLAKGQGKLYAATEALFNALHVVVLSGLIYWLELPGAAIAFAILYLLYTFAMLVLTNYTIGFHWSSQIFKQLAWMGPLALGCFLLDSLFPTIVTTGIGLLVSIGSLVVCMRQLIERVGTNNRIVRFLAKYRLLGTFVGAA